MASGKSPPQVSFGSILNLTPRAVIRQPDSPREWGSRSGAVAREANKAQIVQPVTPLVQRESQREQRESQREQRESQREVPKQQPQRESPREQRESPREQREPPREVQREQHNTPTVREVQAPARVVGPKQDDYLRELDNLNSVLAQLNVPTPVQKPKIVMPSVAATPVTITPVAKPTSTPAVTPAVKPTKPVTTIPTPVVTSAATPVPTTVSAPIITPVTTVTTPVVTPVATHHEPVGKRSRTPKFTQEEIAAMLEGYFRVDPSKWSNILPGAHIRFFKRGETPKAERFYRGGYVRQVKDGVITYGVFISGSHIIQISLSDVAEIWKQYGQSVAVELGMLYALITEQKETIAALQERVAKLEG